MSNVSAVAENIKEVLSPDIQIKDEVIDLIENLEEPQLKVIREQIKKTPAVLIAEKYLNENYEIRFNVIANRIEYKRQEDNEFIEVNPDEINREFLSKKLRFSLGAIKSLLKSDFVNKYNPFEHYFENLPKWKEGEKDHISEFADYITTSTQSRFKYHFKKHLVRTVACSLIKEVVNKQALIFVSPKQNSGKTTLSRFLCPPSLSEYFTENIGTDKDSLIALSENFIINLDELSTLNKTEINALKAIFSKDIVKVRRPYDANTSRANRVCTFVGSTNKAEFLSDETGSVRWLCFDVEKIDFSYKQKINIDMVYAQAYALFKDGFDYELSTKDVAENDQYNRKYQITTAEMELICQNFKPVSISDYDANKGTKGYDASTATELVDEFTETRKQPINRNNLIKALQYYGYEQKSVRKSGGNPYTRYIYQRISNGNIEEVQKDEKNGDLGYPEIWDKK